MKFEFIEKKKVKNETCRIGNIVEVASGAYKGKICLVTYDNLVSLKHPEETWSSWDKFELRKVPVGSQVILTQE